MLAYTMHIPVVFLCFLLMFTVQYTEHLGKGVKNLGVITTATWF